MQPGSLLICVDNKIQNPHWAGILPVIDEYYTCRKCFLDPISKQEMVYVEEIISPMKGNIEPWHSKTWYKEVQPPMNVEEVLKIAEEISI